MAASPGTGPETPVVSDGPAHVPAAWPAAVAAAAAGASSADDDSFSADSSSDAT